MTKTAQPPRVLWRVAWIQREAKAGTTAVIDTDYVEYFETETAVLALLRRLVPNNGRVLAIHKLDMPDRLSARGRDWWVPQTYTPPPAQGTLTPDLPQAAAP